MPDRNQEQMELVAEELDDLDRQVEAGDLDADTAEELRAKYVAELDRLMGERGEQSEPDELDGSTPSPLAGGRGGRITGRTLAGTAVVAIAIAVIGVFAVSSLTGTSTVGAEGVASDVITGNDPVDLSNISNEEMEAVVAGNPEVVGMRLALARRYFQGGDFDKALDHYMVILDTEQHPEALANVGWMTYLSGRPDVALGYVEAALDRQPSMLTALWFLGNIQSALGNYDAAIAALTVIVESDDIPDDVKESAKALLVEMEKG
jgi:tetratricopeptide (TPR) repeat protein